MRYGTFPTTGRLVAMALVLLASVSWALDEERVGAVTAIQGHVERQHAGAHVWEALARGDELRRGDQLHSLPGGRAKLTLRDDSVVSIGDNTMLSIDEQRTTDAPTTRLAVMFGMLRAVASARYAAPGAVFQVETPMALVSAPGGSFALGVLLTKSLTWVTGVGGTVKVESKARPGPVMLEARQYSDVQMGKLPTPPLTLPDDQRDALLATSDVPDDAKTSPAPPPTPAAAAPTGAAPAVR